METLKNILGIMILAATVLSSNVAYSQEQTAKEQRKIERTVRQQKKELYQKADKMIRKEAKKLEKDGWKSMDMPIAKQLETTWEREVLYEPDGYPKYVYVTTDAVGQSFSAAQMEAENVAKIRIAGNIAASVASLADVALANDEISPAQASSLTRAVENAKVIVSAKLGRVFTSSCIYRVRNNNYEVRTTVLYDMRQALNIAHEAITQELKDQSQENRAKLEALLGMDNLVKSYENNNREE